VRPSVAASSLEGLVRLLARQAIASALDKARSEMNPAVAVNVRTGNFTYFDTATHQITSAHVIVSGSLPPGFPATEIEGEYYWDGGLVSNTPLRWVLDSRPRHDTLAFQVDVWSSDGKMPRNLIETEVRQKEIRSLLARVYQYHRPEVVLHPSTSGSGERRGNRLMLPQSV
jgi:predicted acylesterase/phospholipase RssA